MNEPPYVVETARQADLDLDGIADWYLERHPGGLDRFVRDFTNVRKLLEQLPGAGRERPEYRDGLRSYSAFPFLVFYVVDRDAKHVIIERGLHGASDIDTDDFISGSDRPRC